MKGKKSARGFGSVRRLLVQSRHLQNLDVLGVDLEVCGQQPAQFLRVLAFTERMRQLDDPAPFARVRGLGARDKVRVVAGCHGYKACAEGAKSAVSRCTNPRDGTGRD